MTLLLCLNETIDACCYNSKSSQNGKLKSSYFRFQSHIFHAQKRKVKHLRRNYSAMASLWWLLQLILNYLWISKLVKFISAWYTSNKRFPFKRSKLNELLFNDRAHVFEWFNNLLAVSAIIYCRKQEVFTNSFNEGTESSAKTEVNKDTGDTFNQVYD